MAAPSGRVYTDYDRKYQAKPENIAKRVARNKALRMAIKKHGKAALNDKDIHHKDGNATNNSKKNLQITTASHNRSIK